MSMNTYRTLGRCGLAVSPLALGTMTFGVDRWGMERPKTAYAFGDLMGAYDGTVWLRHHSWLR